MLANGIIVEIVSALVEMKGFAEPLKADGVNFVCFSGFNIGRFE